ncbi:hypothetical protein ES731_02315 [Psychroflexus gondwanensis]|jgi:hypothetical protein|uniref:Uncharacterized protein n=1 Tax=Psychroflexus gondwanensis ACAM 44 TaxID=1189619 RepID=N1WZK3_9FLAO|nr:hypothetical protein [Psychroflexus gondwanensis]EMY82494.1 hypothetical protein pgond44_00180 [Psychroflexus gondwanensis ACAM 44]TXE21283.1 hypothetical protein ES731_02315 [Psychroflexus gondwanensis]
MRDELLKKRWETLQNRLSTQFADGDTMELDAIIYLVGVQELGKPQAKFKKDDKVNLMHIAICTLLEPYGFYEFDFVDEDGWPHFNNISKLPVLKAGEQTVLMKEALVSYFLKREYIE